MGEGRHPPAVMAFTGRYAKKHAVSTRRGQTEWNWWYNGYACPVCGKTRRRLANLDRRGRLKDPVCTGNG